jgi:hypothetical protein
VDDAAALFGAVDALSSGVSSTFPLPVNAIAPTPGADSPPPEIEPVTEASRKGISAACTEPATDRSTKPFQRCPAPSVPETKLAMS